MKKKGSFTGSLGFVLAAAGSAVGVGNIWRFPYLAAKDGGGLFLIVYLVLVLTFGFTLLATDVAIGRRTKQNALHAFGAVSYTHLDVYKRQPEYSPPSLWIFLYSEAPCNIPCSEVSPLDHISHI